MAAIAAALGGLSLGTSVLAGQEADDLRRRTRRRGFQGLEGQEASRKEFGTLQENQLLQALQAIQGGFNTAQGEIGRVGRGRKQSILDRETALQGDLQQQFVSAGFGVGGGTPGANVQRGLAADTNRRLTDLDSSLAGLFSDLATRRAGAEAGAHGNLAGFFGQQGQIQQGIEQQRTNFLTGQFGEQTDFGGGGLDLAGIAKLAAQLKGGG